MVKATICIEGEANSIINIVKAAKGFKDKSQVINYIVLEYAEEILDKESFNEKFIQSVLANKNGDHSERIDITSEAARKELLGL
ncbi:hypothetical protein MMKA1_p-00040 (plasmid) [Methanococcus maripaludis KA1]|uniref:Antitoxin n=1 Tax=Methanococcus maripaludis KA1 TaxID=637914 RepID=A0A2Z5PRS8_METMI|nr:DUF2683 family protein [Methanococcus maripaludis]BAP62077.1 hypothetical protein MMKA1_p-00040 [Methanococcus maripaludis KA1]